MSIFERTQLIIGQEALKKLADSHVVVFGVGGVGSFVCEALARAGVGRLTIFDDDTVAESNINRQLVALHSTIGMPKVEVMAQRINDINPNCSVTQNRCFYTAENAEQYPFDDADFIVDAIDTVSSKLLLIEQANKANVPIICSMGTGNKLDPSRFEITDISKTSVCPLAKVMRKELKNRGIKHVTVLYSKEEPIKPAQLEKTDSAADASPYRKGGSSRRQTPGSISFVPSVAGLTIAGHVINRLIAEK